MSQIYCSALQSGLHSHRVKASPWYKSFYMIFKREFCIWSSTKFVSVLELGKYITNCQQQDKLLRTEDTHTILYLNTKAPVLLSQKILELMITESLEDWSEKNHYMVTPFWCSTLGNYYSLNYWLPSKTKYWGKGAYQLSFNLVWLHSYVFMQNSIECAEHKKN